MGAKKKKKKKKKERKRNKSVYFETRRYQFFKRGSKRGDRDEGGVKVQTTGAFRYTFREVVFHRTARSFRNNFKSYITRINTS